jgi:hypothetical protein
MDSEAVLTLSSLTGRSVRTADGRVGGVLRDLTVRLSDERPRVERLLVVRRRVHHLVPWSAVALDGDRVIVRGEQADRLLRADRLHVDDDGLDLDADELLLARDVLDCQIVDLKGHRLTRASDVVLSRTPEGGELELVGVEVGFAAMLRRLGFEWFAQRLRRQVVPIDELHLTSVRGHQVQLAAATSVVHRLDAAGLSHLVTRLDVAKATEVLDAVGPGRAAEALLKTHPVVGRRLMWALPDRQSSRVRRHLPPGSAVTHPHLHQPMSSRPRRLRRLAGWRNHYPPEVS